MNSLMNVFTPLVSTRRKPSSLLTPNVHWPAFGRTTVPVTSITKSSTS